MKFYERSAIVLIATVWFFVLFSWRLELSKKSFSLLWEEYPSVMFEGTLFEAIVFFSVSIICLFLLFAVIGLIFHGLGKD